MTQTYVVALDQRAIVNQRVYVKVQASSEGEALELALDGEAFAISKTFHNDTKEVLSEDGFVLAPDGAGWEDIKEWQE